MLNLYDHSLKANYKRLECEELLFVEYQCAPGKNAIDTLWSPHGHLVFVTSGKKTWITPDGDHTALSGDAVYCKEGACVMRNFYDTEFCALIFFFPKDFIKEVVLEYRINLANENLPPSMNFHVLKIKIDACLKLFFESVSSYLFLNDKPSEHLLKLKFKELVLQVLTTDCNPELKSYFISTLSESKVGIESVVRQNLLYNLSVGDYAQLCNRSISTFKREFKEIFGTTPQQWIIEERLNYARTRLLNTDENINEVSFYSGFESTSNFIRSFKKQFGHPPLKYKMSLKSP